MCRVFSRNIFSTYPSGDGIPVTVSKVGNSNHYWTRPLILILPDVHRPEAAEVLWWRRLNRQVQGHPLQIHRGEEVGDALLLHRTRHALLSSGAEVEGRGEAEEALLITLGEALAGWWGSRWRVGSFLGLRRADRPGLRHVEGIVWEEKKSFVLKDLNFTQPIIQIPVQDTAYLALRLQPCLKLCTFEKDLIPESGKMTEHGVAAARLASVPVEASQTNLESLSLVSDIKQSSKLCSPWRCVVF